MEEEASALYNVLKEIFLLLEDGDRRLLAAFTLTIPRFYALNHLGKHPGLSVSELSVLMFCDKSNVTRLVQSMEAEELVRRQDHESDGRVHCLFLTPLGEKLRQEVLALHRQFNADRFGASMDPLELAALFSSLETIRDALQFELAQSEPSLELVS